MWLGCPYALTLLSSELEWASVLAFGTGQPTIAGRLSSGILKGVGFWLYQCHYLVPAGDWRWASYQFLVPTPGIIQGQTAMLAYRRLQETSVPSHTNEDSEALATDRVQPALWKLMPCSYAFFLVSASEHTNWMGLYLAQEWARWELISLHTMANHEQIITTPQNYPAAVSWPCCCTYL